MLVMISSQPLLQRKDNNWHLAYSVSKKKGLLNPFPPGQSPFETVYLDH